MIKVIVVGLLIITVVGFADYLVKKAECDQKAKVMGLPSSFTLLTDCMIEHKPGHWIPIIRIE